MNGTFSHRRRLLGAWACAALLAALVACGVPTPPTVEAPEITAFTATPAGIEAGDDATLAWTIAGTATVTLTDGTDPVDIPSGASQVVVSPATTTTYTLTATNDGGTDTADVTVVVTPPGPQITSFTATPSEIVEGDDSTLSWSVVGATTIALSDGTDPVAFTPGETSVVVSPTVTTTYTLTATNDDGDATAQVTVDVTEPLPQITSFTAAPSSIPEGDDSTLSWSVVGATTIALSDGTDPVAFTPGETSVVVSPTVTTTYTLTATNDAGEVTSDATVTVVPAGVTSLADLTAEVVAGSQVELDWTVLNATAVDVLTVANGDPNDELLVVSLGGAAETHTLAIPISTRQVLRVCARAVDPANDVCLDATPSNVVLNVLDYDPYDLSGFTPEPEVAGSLRSVVANAAPGSVVGFAADVTAIDLYGVALYPPGTGNFDAHLIFGKDLTLSGPATGVTLTGISGYDVGVDPDDDAGGFTYRSRMVFVASGFDVVLENLTITGGTFIYKGGGIANAGTLTGRNLTVTDNRAWDVGGGIHNFTGATLTLEDSVISDNRAVTEVAEVGVPYSIRGAFVICMIRSGFGGGLYNESGATATLTDTDVTGNEALVSGGGIYNAPGGSITITGGSVSGNVANHDPYTSDPAFPDPPLYTDPTDGCETDATAFEPYSIGGGVYNGGTLSMASGSILDNDVNAAGGGLFIDRNLQMTTLTNVLVQGNEAGIDNPPGFGGGIQHEYYVDDGATSNYTATSVSYGTGNSPSDLTTNPIPGSAPIVIAPDGAGDLLPGRYVPTPGVRDR